MKDNMERESREDRSTNFKRAVNSKQYDLPDLQWEKHKGLESPSRQFFYEYLRPYIKEFKGKSVLEVGAGSAWLSDEIRKAGASTILALEPSEKNIRLAKENYPLIKVAEGSLESFEPKNQKFDRVVANMVFSHVENLNEGLSKIREMSSEGSELIITVPDFDYFKTPRFNTGLEVENLNEREYICVVTRRIGVLADVVRKNEVYEETAQEVGFETLEVVPMKPTPNFIEQLPQYEQFKDKAIAQLLRFRIGQ